jgi:hypothetical protein
MKSTSYKHKMVTNVQGQHHRTAAQKAEDMERHLQSLDRLAGNPETCNIATEVNIHSKKLRWLYLTKHRAKVKRIPFDLTIDDLELPDKCPILGLRLQFNTVEADDNSYSLDRIDNSKGYTKDNVQIISLKANILKSSGTLDQLIKMGEWAKAYKEKQSNKAKDS